MRNSGFKIKFRKCEDFMEISDKFIKISTEEKN